MPTPPRTRYAIHLPELRQSVEVEAETVYRMREGPDWASDGVGLRFGSFEPGAEADWIAYVSALGQAGRMPAARA
jgi:hypothetical protein